MSSPDSVPLLPPDSSPPMTCPMCGGPVAAASARCPDCGMSLAGVDGRPGPFTRRTLWWWAGGLLVIYLVVLAIVAIAS